MKNRVKKMWNVIVRNSIKPIAFIKPSLYTKLLTKYLKHNGMNILGEPFYFSRSIYFDGSDYGLITIEDGVSISANVTFLTHDFSANTVYKGMNLTNQAELEAEYKRTRLRSLKPIRVGHNTFIGMNTLILPGVDIGAHCIIGGGSVVRGRIPDNSIAFGNPAIVIKRTSDWLEGKRFSDI